MGSQPHIKFAVQVFWTPRHHKLHEVSLGKNYLIGFQSYNLYSTLLVVCFYLRAAGTCFCVSLVNFLHFSYYAVDFLTSYRVTTPFLDMNITTLDLGKIYARISHQRYSFQEYCFGEDYMRYKKTLMVFSFCLTVNCEFFRKRELEKKKNLLWSEKRLKYKNL